MVGTDPRGRGGIASVALLLRQSGFFERQEVRYVVSHVDGSGWRKLRVALAAWCQVLLACLPPRPPIVHVHCASHASFYRKSVLLATARACGSHTVFHLHSGGFRQFAETESGPVARWWIRHTLARSSRVIALSDSAAGDLGALAPAADVRVLVNSVPVGAAADPAREQGARILFLGRASRQKGVFELLAAVAALRAEFPDIMLVIGGDGDLAALRRAADELGIGARVVLPGWLGAREKDEQLGRAAIFALPSHHEGLPMAMLEAMAAGKAVVATAVGGIPEAVRDHDNGLLVPPGDVAALAAALRTLLGDAALRAALARRARDTVLQRYSGEAAAGQLAALYGELERRGRRAARGG